MDHINEFYHHVSILVFVELALGRAKGEALEAEEDYKIVADAQDS